ncbi:MAG: YfcE family phosphodiesterase [Balneolales bacterium]|nr:YfcE family phosphodiesterase [Balneolales bacterium]
MKIGILSDTHDHLVNTRVALSMLRNLQAEVLLHAGDFCSPFMIPLFAKWELHGVFGNNDGDHFRIQQKFGDINGRLHGEFMDEIFDGKRVAMYHGTQPGITEALIRSAMYDVVVSGHLHEATNRVYTHPQLNENVDFNRKEQTLHVNPGTVNGLGGVATFAIYDTATGFAEVVGLD